MTLPRPTPTKVMAEAMSFLVLPPVLLLTKAREKEKTAFEAPVKSARQ
jgi:hypothetical protein